MMNAPTPKDMPGLKDPNAPTNSRRAGRVFCQDVTCSLGEIRDLSASGMRVRTRQKPPPLNQPITLTLETLDGPMVIGCEVVWARRTGFFQRELGVTFRGLNDRTRLALSRLAQASAYNETIRPAVEAARKAS
ncbi:MAG: PilZ domain-containing protein [Phycisphaerales bacterium]|jgi:hypothetical protein|nr:PilZ domain-containing protein [Phycisphaerales bacterium]